MNGIRDALVRLLRVYDREVALDKAVRGIGSADNYHFNNWSEIVDAINYMITGGTQDDMMDSAVYRIIKSSIASERKVELLMAEYKNANRVVMCAPNLMDRQEIIAMARENGGYIPPEARQS